MAEVKCEGCSYALAREDNFCTSCGLKVPKFCSKCGKTTLSCICKKKECEKEAKSLRDYLSEKGKERVSFPTKKSLGTSKNLKQHKTETINMTVGLIKPDNIGELKIKRGSRATISISPNACWETVKELALEKHSNLDQYFTRYDDYVLLYPDKKLCHLLPGGNTPFTVEKYKQFLKKPYGKLELFLCLEVDFLHDNDNNENKLLLHNDDDDVSLLPVSNTFLHENNDDKLLLRDYDFLELHNDEFPDLLSSINSNNFDVQSSSKGESKNLQKQRKVLCPTCGKSYPIHVIVEHADACAEATNNTFAKEIQSCARERVTNNTSDDEIVITYKEVLPEPKTMLSSVIKNCCVEMDASAPKINLEVFRGSCFKDFHSYFSKTWNKDKIACRYEISFAGESGQDQGGLRREFYTEAMQEIKNAYFIGNDESLEPVCSTYYVTDGTMRSIGHLMAASICNLGPAPNFLTEWVYHFIIGGATEVHKNLPCELIDCEGDFQEIYEKIYKCDSTAAIQSIMTSDIGFEVLEIIGYPGSPSFIKFEEKCNILGSLFLKLKIEKYANVIGEIIHGLNKFNLVHHMQINPSVFKLLFCKSDIFMWTIDGFFEALSIHWSTHGSNEKKAELETYKAFKEMLEISFHDENAFFKLSDVTKFMTGSRTLTPGSAVSLKLYFKHNCESNCQCLPTASTCDMHVVLPVHYSTLEVITEGFDTAITACTTYGFGLL